MARTAMSIGSGQRISNYLSIGLLAKTYPMDKVKKILESTGRQSQRVRDLPAEVMVYYVIALGLYMAASTGEVMRCLLEGLHQMGGMKSIKVASKGGISRGRTRIGSLPMKALWEQSSELLGQAEQPGCFYKDLRVMALDGSTMDLQDTKTNLSHFGRQEASRGQAAFPQLRFVGLCECGPHSVYAAAVGPYGKSEQALAQDVICHLRPKMLCLADRLYSVYSLWQQAQSTGAELLWRARDNALLHPEELLPDGSYLATIYPSTKARRKEEHGIRVRVIEYAIKIPKQPEKNYRLMTTILDSKQAPAKDLASLYSQRWEIEGIFDEIKTHLRGGARIILRSKTPNLVEQEFYGLLLAHRAIRTLIYGAAQEIKIDPDRLSFTHALRLIRRKLVAKPAFSPSQDQELDDIA